MRMKLMGLGFAIAIAVTLALSVFGSGTAQAHGGDHGSCKNFGSFLVADILAGPEFGQFHRDFAKTSQPGDVASMVGAEGHAFCDPR